MSRVEHSAKATLIAGLCSASLLAAPVSAPAKPPPTLDEAIVEFSEAVWPIIEIQNTALPEFTEQVAALIFSSVEPGKLAKAIDVSLDALTSVPSDKVTELNGVVKEAFNGLDASSCGVVPLPPKGLVGKIANTQALSLVDKGKVKALDAKWSETLKLLPTRDDYPGPDGALYSVICLPPPAKLDQLALAQASVGRSIGAAEAKRFADVVPATLKTIPPTDAIPLAKQAEKLAKIPAEQKVRLNAARKAVEKAAEQEAYKARLAATNARSAQAKAELQAQNEAREAARAAIK